MRLKITEVEKDGSWDCECLDRNIVVESVVLSLVLVSALAITGENLLLFQLITVPQSQPAANLTRADNQTNQSDNQLVENRLARDTILRVCHFTSLGIAAVFMLEVFLKVCTLRKKYLTCPWQVFDCLVVAASLALEITFHIIMLSQLGLHSLTYVVVLRLWRVPMLCNIRARTVLAESEHDMELYRNGRVKAEEKCRQFEKLLTQQSDTIQKLESLLQNVSSSNLYGIGTKSKHNGQVLHLTPDVSAIFSKSSGLKSAANGQLSYTSFLDASKNRAETTSVGEVETHFMLQLQSENEINNKFKLQHKRTRSKSSSNSNGWINVAPNDVNMSRHTVNPAVPTTGDCGQRTNSSKSLTQSDWSHVSSSTLPGGHCVGARPWKRRSSTSDIITLSSLQSHETRLNDRELTLASLDSGDSTSGARGTTVSQTSVLSASNLSAAGKNSSKDLVTAVSTGGPGEDRQRKKIRRFMSCPEYVFTQRTSISSDETLLIQESQASRESAHYCNLGFDDTEHLHLEVLAEIDGTKTYRNEDGIPMTSL